MGLCTTLAAQQLELRTRFDTLGGSRNTEALAEPRHRANDGHGIVARCEFAHERTVDLDLVERETAQIAQRRITGAKIVERDLDAHRAELVQDRKRPLAVLQQHRFGDLQFEPMRRQAR